MCGILVYTDPPSNVGDLRDEVKKRGPDFFGTADAGGVHFESSVLSLRRPLTPQPLADPLGVLSFNGEIYATDNAEVGADTALFLQTLRESVHAAYALEGEFAFAYLDLLNHTLIFGRDRVGRRSLGYWLGSGIVVSSVGGDGYVECDGGVVYTYDLRTKEVTTADLSQPLSLGLSALRIGDEEMKSHALEVVARLRRAVKRRCERPPDEAIDLLYSGGLDCSLLAALLDETLPPGTTVSLLNVAFASPRRAQTGFDTPDRQLARHAFAELNMARPGRFRLVEIDVPYETTLAHRARVTRLMAPSATVMDLSIAIAFYFATQPPQDSTPYGRIVFSGLGADELFGGYSRHTAAAASGDAQRLAGELEKDFHRLAHHNLGRDDRIVSSWGREVRYPFLDAEVVDLAAVLPLGAKNAASDEPGGPTKRVLRAAAVLLGLPVAAAAPKRAIQFGARSAKMDLGSGRARGQDSLA